MATQLAVKKEALGMQDATGKILTQDKIQGVIARVKAAVAPFVTKQEELGKKIKRLEIKDQASYDRANELFREIKGNLDDGIEIAGPVVELANTLHKGLTAERKSVQDLATANRSALTLKLKEFDDEMAKQQAERDRQAQLEAQRKADEERRAREKAEREAKEKAFKAAEEAAERRRIADEALAKARAEEDEAALREAEKLASKADRAETKSDAAQATLDVAQAVSAEPIVVEEVRAAPIIDRAASAGTWVDNWVGKCDDVWAAIRFIVGVPEGHVIAHPGLMKLITHDEKQLNLMAGAQKEVFRVPGLRAVNEKFLRGRR